MKKIIILLLVGIVTFTAYSNETAVKVKAPGYNSVNVLESDKSDLIYAGTWGDGIYTSSNKGTAFQTKNTGLGNLFINDIAFDSQNHVYVGTQGDGIYKSTNSGNVWTKLAYSGNMNVTSLYINPDDDNHIYAGTYGSGLYYSTDGGTSWEQRNRSVDNNGLNITIESLHITAIALTGDGTLIVGTYGDGAYRSEDNGLNWRRGNSGTGSTKFINQISVISNDLVLMATNDNGLFESFNHGLLWTEYESGADSLKDDAITCLEYVDDFAVVGTREHGIWFYNPQPNTDWLPSGYRKEGIVDMTMLTDGTLLAYDLYNGLSVSTNKGKVWVSASLGTSDSKSRVANIGNEYVLNVDDKMYISSNLGDSWTELTSFEGGTTNELKFQQNRLIALMPNKALISTDKGTSWTSITPGDVDDILDDIVFMPNGNILASLIFVDISDPMSPILRQELHKSTDGGSSWTIIQNYPDDMNSGTKLTVDPNNNIFYSKSDKDFNHLILRSTDGGTTFSTTNYNVDRKPLQFEYSFGTLFLSTSKGLYSSKDNGANYKLYDIPIQERPDGYAQATKYVATFAVGSANEVYVGLDNTWGVYHTTNGGAEWDSLNSGINTGRLYDMALNSNRDLFFAGDRLYKYLNKLQMPAPQLTLPANDALNQVVDLTFDWETSNKAELYNFQISANSSFTFAYEDIITSSTEHNIFYKLSPATKYYWRVRGKTGGVYGNWSSVFNFTTLIGSPNLVSPANDTVSVPHLTEFRWDAVDGASKYRLYVATDIDMNDVVVQQDDITEATYTLIESQKLSPLTTYYWAVAVQGDDDSEGELSEIWKFRTILDAPILTFPEDNSVNQPDSLVFTWDRVTEAVDYQFQLSRLSDFSIIVRDNQTLNIASQSISELANNAFYYWRVRATDTNGVKGPWSEIWSFKTGQERPKHISPANNSGGLPSDVTLDWTDVKDYNYGLQVADNPEFAEPLLVNQTLTESEFDLKDIAKNKTFYWRVRAVLNDTISPWTDAWNFSTGLARTVLLLPEDKSEQPSDISILFRWETTSGADSYQLQVSNNDSFTNMFLDTMDIPTNSRNVNGLVDGNTYFWRIKAFAGEQGNDWSEVRSFNIKKIISSVLSADDSGILIYPNPAREEITINIPIELMSTIQSATIVSQTGQELSKQLINTSIQQVDISSFTNGVYYIILEGEDNRFLFKLNKIK